MWAPRLLACIAREQIKPSPRSLSICMAARHARMRPGQRTHARACAPARRCTTDSLHGCAVNTTASTCTHGADIFVYCQGPPQA